MAVAVTEDHMKGKMKTFGSSVELGNQIQCSLQEKNKNMILTESALEREKYLMRWDRF